MDVHWLQPEVRAHCAYLYDNFLQRLADGQAESMLCARILEECWHRTSPPLPNATLVSTASIPSAPALWRWPSVGLATEHAIEQRVCAEKHMHHAQTHRRTCGPWRSVLAELSGHHIRTSYARYSNPKAKVYAMGLTHLFPPPTPHPQPPPPLQRSWSIKMRNGLSCRPTATTAGPETFSNSITGMMAKPWMLFANNTQI